MFRTGIMKLAPKRMNAFAVFARSAWTLPKIASSNASFKAKSKVVHAAWKKLSPAAKARFASIAARTPLPRAAPRKLSPWQKHIKANYKKVAKLPFKKRLAALAKTYKK